MTKDLYEANILVENVPKVVRLSSKAMFILRELFLNGPIRDLDIVDKEARGELFKFELAYREEGYTFINAIGIKTALAFRFDHTKKPKPNLNATITVTCDQATCACKQQELVTA